MIVLGIDLGERRIGVAVSDPLAVIAQPATVIEHASLAEDVARVGALAAQRKAERIVVGLPWNMDGSPGPATRRARRFANALRKRLGLDVVLWDERLTTLEADEALAAAGRGREERMETIDKAAAAVILQRYLDAQREGDGR